MGKIIGSRASAGHTVPGAPTSLSASNVGTGRAYNNGSATVSFTAPTNTGKLPITSYTVTSSPGSFTASGASSPLTVTGLQSSTSYTFTATASNSTGASTSSSASASITATTVPQAPTIGSASDGGTGTTASVSFTAGANGGAAVSTFTATSSPGGFTGTSASSPITVSGLTAGTAYTFTVTATNSNGTSTASSASNSVTIVTPTAYDSIATISPSGTGTVTFSSIPQTYKHLQIRAITKFNQTSAGDYTDILVAFNGVALNRSHMLRADSALSASSSTQSIGFSISNHSTTTDCFATLIMDVHDYTSTTRNKTARGMSGMLGNFSPRVVGLTSAMTTSTSAVSSITFTNASGVFWVAGTQFALYGIKG